MAVAFLIAGVVVWRMMSQGQTCKAVGGLSCVLMPPHRLHPLRAEVLWAVSALCGLVAIGLSFRLWRPRARLPIVNG
jgi:hypothetical protein